MAYKIVISEGAKADLDSIMDYLSLFGLQPLKNFRDKYNKQLDILKDGVINYPFSRFPELANLGYHSIFFNNYVLLYYEDENKRVVSHVFHQSQNYAKLV